MAAKVPAKYVFPVAEVVGQFIPVVFQALGKNRKNALRGI